mmetsp:Transcript_66781/g.118196  ORF Transcript_66781/g.118196 Transcript_66781/m.118196 type:complete len:269 (+) Transcript_66781:1965-2771(+)
MCNQDNLLIGEVVEQQVHNLHCGISFACSRRSHNHGQSRIDSGTDGFHLDRCKANLVLSGLALRIRSHVRQRVCRSNYSFKLSLACRTISNLLKLQTEWALKLLRHVDILSVRERLKDVIFIDESVPEVDRVQCSRQLPILSSARISIAEEEVVQPIWHHCVLVVHKASDGVKNCFEVVLFRPSADDKVQRRVDLALALGHRLQVLVILCRVQEHPCHTVVSNWSFPFRWIRVTDYVALVIQKLGDFGPAKGHDSKRLWELGNREVLH